MIHNPQMECMSREDMTKLQSERLAATVKRCYETVPFYKRKMDERGVKPEDIKSIKDVTKLPFTTKYDLRDEYPFGLQAVPMDKIRRIHASSGTTGKPVVGTYTQADLDMWAECVARVFAVGDIGPGDVVQVSYGYGPLLVDLVRTTAWPNLARYSSPPLLAIPKSKSCSCKTWAQQPSAVRRRMRCIWQK